MNKVFDACCKQLKIECLRPFQQHCVVELLNGQNVFLSCKTGSGKSVCFESFPIVIGHFPRTSLGSIVIIVEPLLAINEEGIRRVTSLGFPATYIGRDDSEREMIISGGFTYVFTSAENILDNEQYRSMLTSSAYRQRDVLLVIDEAHTIVNW